MRMDCCFLLQPWKNCSQFSLSPFLMVSLATSSPSASTSVATAAAAATTTTTTTTSATEDE